MPPAGHTLCRSGGCGGGGVRGPVGSSRRTAWCSGPTASIVPCQVYSSTSGEDWVWRINRLSELDWLSGRALGGRRLVRRGRLAGADLEGWIREQMACGGCVGRDVRRVQTAVIGEAESEVPVSLPMEAIEVDVFRQFHRQDTFWCGVWLGGCGGRLTTKLYVDRACHFAHLPHPDEPNRRCTRRSSDVASADHLYIKAALLQWLAEQEISAQGRIGNGEDGRSRLGGEIHFRLHARKPLRVLLDHGANGAPAAAAPEALLGPGVAHHTPLLTERGYVHRIRCESAGTARRVQIGTQRYTGTDWFELSECEMAPFGLSTPAVQEVRQLRSAHRPLGSTTGHQPHPSTPPSRPVAVPEAVPDRVEAFSQMRAALADGSNITKLRRCLAKAEAATANGASLEENHLLRQAADALLRLERGVGAPAIAPAPREKRRARPVPQQSPPRYADALRPKRYKSC
ncbi:competence protein CoiA family protein [Streptomyces sp. NPDC048644]|uniref:competence protein CoiA family protein n=1 Tax=Streptomyces sp. NPDC048644 TaxID=3365582 RepID=UPI003719EA91